MPHTISVGGGGLVSEMKICYKKCQGIHFGLVEVNYQQYDLQSKWIYTVTAGSFFFTGSFLFISSHQALFCWHFITEYIIFFHISLLVTAPRIWLWSFMLMEDLCDGVHLFQGIMLYFSPHIFKCAWHIRLCQARSRVWLIECTCKVRNIALAEYLYFNTHF